MGTARRGNDIDSIMRRLRSEAELVHGAPDEAARRAAAVTAHKFKGLTSRSGHGMERRVTEYFWAVLRRQAFCGGAEATALRERYLLAALAQDLAEAGHAPASVFGQLVGHFGGSVCGEVLERYRPLQPS